MRSKSHVLLLGDSLGDLNMAKGVEAEELLTIGFLNDNVRFLDFFFGPGRCSRFCSWSLMQNQF